MPRNLQTHLIKRCPSCGFELPFDHPYGFHARLSDLGLLYNDAGDNAFIWSNYDPDYSGLVDECHPWVLSTGQRAKIEAALSAVPCRRRLAILQSSPMRAVPRCD